MRGDYLYCLHCGKLSVDNYDVGDTRTGKFKGMCPYCTGTNTVNANVALGATTRWSLLLKTRTMTKEQVKEIAEQLKAEGVLKKYKLYSRKNTIYLYDTTDIKQEILVAAEKQGITVTPAVEKRQV